MVIRASSDVEFVSALQVRAASKFWWTRYGEVEGSSLIIYGMKIN
jgi:hypothetical protein